MPLISARFFEGRLTPATEKTLIEKLTNAVTDVFGDDVRPHTWVILDEVPRRRWSTGMPASGQ
jgi:4-oxalocrotonate tautomerase